MTKSAKAKYIMPFLSELAKKSDKGRKLTPQDLERAFDLMDEKLNHKLSTLIILNSK